MRVFALDRVDLPLPRPFFHGFSALDGLVDGGKLLVPHQKMDFVFPREGRAFTSAMLFDPDDDVVGDTDVEGAVFLAGKELDEIAGHHACSHRR